MRVLGPGRTFRGHHSGAANSARAQTVMSEPSHPLVSVVVPTCNRADLLRRCLDRLAPGAQRLDAARYEVIVADDGAPGSAAMAIEKTHPWARTVDGPRRGPAANRNAGAGAARGAYLAFTDDDTEPSPAWLASFVAAIEPGTDVYEGRTPRALLRTIVRYRLGVIHHTPKSLDSVGALWSLAREVVHVMRRVASWEARYAAEFPDTPPRAA